MRAQRETAFPDILPLSPFCQEHVYIANAESIIYVYVRNQGDYLKNNITLLSFFVQLLNYNLNLNALIVYTFVYHKIKFNREVNIIKY